MSDDNRPPARSSAGGDDLEAVLRQRDDALRELDRIRGSRSYKLAKALNGPRELLKKSAGLNPRAGRRATASAPGAPISNAAPRAHSRQDDASPPGRVEQPDVSIVVPVYNSAAWVTECLSSVLAQSGIDIEVICIDDGSTDSSHGVLRNHARTDARVSVIRQENRGQSVARNVGIDAAAGRYIVFLDSDDFWTSDGLASLVATSDRQNLDVLLFDGTAFRDGDVDEAVWNRYASYYGRTAQYDAVRTGAQMIHDMRSRRDYRPHVGMYMARTEYVREAGVRFIPGIIHQDNPYTFSLLLDAKRTAHSAQVVYGRRLRPGSTITTLRAADSTRGYFLGYLSMARALQNRRPAESVGAGVYDVVHGVLDGAQKAARTLTRDQKAALRALDARADAQLAVRAMLGGM